MAYKPSPNSLIHCAECGEDYSATYKRCPFCGAKNAPPAEPEARQPADPDDTYVFDGQDLFDDPGEDNYASARPRGGKRLADKPMANPFAAGSDINWPRMITFICSLVIIVAAMVIVFTVVYPQLRGDPAADGSQSPSSPASEPGSDASQSVSPVVTDPGTDATDPVVEPTLDLPPVDPNGLTTIAFKGAHDDDFTLQPGESHTITLKFDPEGWAGTVTWTSSDTSYATVDANGKVTNVNTTDRLRSVTITATAAGLTLESKVYCRGIAASEPPSSDPPAVQTPSAPGTVTVGRQGTIVNASGGLNVRSGPGTSYNRIGSLWNGSTVNVLEDAGNGWYKISYRGSSGTVEGYIMGDYISMS